VQVGIAPAKDEDRLLQGFEPAGQSFRATLRFSGFYVSTPAIDESRWQTVRHFFSAISDKAAKAMRNVVRRWKLHHRGDLALEPPSEALLKPVAMVPSCKKPSAKPISASPGFHLENLG
jgi:hypothetical protein